MASSGAVSGSAASVSSSAPSLQEYVVRVPKNQNKKFSIMRFNGAIGVDFTKWNQVKMERENNMVQFKSFTEDMPKFGSGSEYGREQREEARRKKYGIISKKYRPEDQPWVLQHGGKQGKKFRGVREGGVTENASYYVFTQATDGAFEAFPVEEWYNFQTVQRYKALSYEEAEEEFNSRDRTYNLWSVMLRKRMKKEDEAGDDGDEEGEGKGKGKKKKNAKGELRISEMDDWLESSEGESSNEDDDEDGAEKKEKKKKGKKGAKPKKKRQNGSDDEPLEDSDDGDGEGREVDYISSSSEESDIDHDAKNELKGVAEEDALRRLLNSDEEDDEENKEEEVKDKDDENEDGADADADNGPPKDHKEDKKKKDKKKNKDKKPRKEDYGSSSESDSGSSVAEMEKPKASPKLKSASAESSRSATPTKPGMSMPEPTSDLKRKGNVDVGPSQKKQRLDIAAAAAAAASASTSSSSSDKDVVNEESVRRYLSRKPMTTTELLQKFKSKRTGHSSDQLVHVIAQILKKINPVKQTIKGKMYLSIKA